MIGQVGISHHSEPTRQKIKQQGFGHLVIEDLGEGPPTLMENSQGAKPCQALVRVHPGGNQVPMVDPEPEGEDQDERNKNNFGHPFFGFYFFRR